MNFSASLIVFFKSSQYKLIDLLASSLPGIGKSISVGSEFVSKTAIIGIPNFFASATASDSILVSMININYRTLVASGLLILLLFAVGYLFVWDVINRPVNLSAGLELDDQGRFLLTVE